MTRLKKREASSFLSGPLLPACSSNKTKSPVTSLEGTCTHIWCSSFGSCHRNRVHPKLLARIAKGAKGARIHKSRTTKANKETSKLAQVSLPQPTPPRRIIAMHVGPAQREQMEKSIPWIFFGQGLTICFPNIFLSKKVTVFLLCGTLMSLDIP